MSLFPGRIPIPSNEIYSQLIEMGVSFDYDSIVKISNISYFRYRLPNRWTWETSGNENEEPYYVILDLDRHVRFIISHHWNTERGEELLINIHSGYHRKTRDLPREEDEIQMPISQTFVDDIPIYGNY